MAVGVEREVFNVDVVVGQVEVGPVLTVSGIGGADAIGRLVLEFDAVEGEKVGDFELFVTLDLITAEGAQLDTAHVAAVVGEAVEIERRLVGLRVVGSELRESVCIGGRGDQIIDDLIERFAAGEAIFGESRDVRRPGDVADDVAPEGVEGADDDPVEVVAETVANFFGGLAVEGEDEDFFGERALVVNEVGNLANDHTGLARAGAGQHKCGVFISGDSGSLLVGGSDGERGCHGIVDGGQRCSDEFAVGVGAGALEVVGRGDSVQTAPGRDGVNGELRADDCSACGCQRGRRLKAQLFAVAVAEVALAREGAIEFGLLRDELPAGLFGAPGGFVAESGRKPGGVALWQAANRVLHAGGRVDDEARPEPGAFFTHIVNVGERYLDGAAAFDAQHTL